MMCLLLRLGSGALVRPMRLGVLAAAGLLACTPSRMSWPEAKPTGALCYDQVPVPVEAVARQLEAAWAQSPNLHFTAADLRRLRTPSDSAAHTGGEAAPLPDSILFKATTHHYQNESTSWRLKTANGQVLYTLILQASAQADESALCAVPLKWLTRPLPQAGLTPAERALARQWMAQDLARLLPLLPPPLPPQLQ